MRKILCVLLVTLLALSCLTPALAVNEDVEGELVIYTSMYKDVVEMMDEALKAEFPNLVPGNGGSFFFQNGSGNLITMIYGEMGDDRTGPLGCDMLMMAEPSFSLEMKEYGYLHSFEVDDPENLLRFPCDPDGTWYPSRVCNMVLAYNPDMEADWAAKGVTIPKSFHDFAYDSSLQGKISMGDPMTSGTAYSAIVALTDKYGEEYLDKLAENKVMRQSGSSAIDSLQNGECAAIMILEESVLMNLHENEKSGHPVTNLQVIYPEDGTVLIPSPVMIVEESLSKNVNVDAAEAVARWFLTKDGQKAVLAGYMHSVLKNDPDIPWHSVSTDELIEKGMSVDWERAFRDREEIRSLWTEKVTQ